MWRLFQYHLSWSSLWNLCSCWMFDSPLLFLEKLKISFMDSVFLQWIEVDLWYRSVLSPYSLSQLPGENKTNITASYFPHMPPCLPGSSFPKSTGSASTSPSPRMWSTGSAAARASANRRAASGAVGARTTPSGTTDPNGPARCLEMEENLEGGVRGRGTGAGSLSLEYLHILPLDPIRGEHMTPNQLFLTNIYMRLCLSIVYQWDTCQQVNRKTQASCLSSPHKDPGMKPSRVWDDVFTTQVLSFLSVMQHNNNTTMGLVSTWT